MLELFDIDLKTAIIKCFNSNLKHTLNKLKKKKAYRVQPRRWPPLACGLFPGCPGCLDARQCRVWVTLWPGVAKGCLWCCCSGSAWQTLPSLSLQTAFPTSVRLTLRVLCPALYSHCFQSSSLELRRDMS